MGQKEKCINLLNIFINKYTQLLNSPSILQVYTNKIKQQNKVVHTLTVLRNDFNKYYNYSPKIRIDNLEKEYTEEYLLKLLQYNHKKINIALFPSDFSSNINTQTAYVEFVSQTRSRKSLIYMWEILYCIKYKATLEEIRDSNYVYKENPLKNYQIFQLDTDSNPVCSVTLDDKKFK